MMSIELKHLRYTEVADRYGSFRKAAASLALNQAVDARRSRRGIQPHYLLLCSRIWYVPIWTRRAAIRAPSVATG
jgi:hypothetical protein